MGHEKPQPKQGPWDLKSWDPVSPSLSTTCHGSHGSGNGRCWDRSTCLLREGEREGKEEGRGGVGGEREKEREGQRNTMGLT